MKVRNLFAFVLILLAVSCSKKSDPVATVTGSCLLTKRVETTPDHRTTTLYTYDSNGKLLIKITKSFEYTPANPNAPTGAVFTYTYSGAIVTRVKADFTGGTSAGSYTSDWTVNDGGRLTMLTISGGTSEKVTFTYDGQGRFQSSSYVIGTTTGGTTATYDTGGGVATMKTTVQIPGVLTATDEWKVLTVDGKKNPYTLLAQATNQPIYFDGIEGNIFPEFLTSANTFTGNRQTTSNGSSNASGYAYSYEYNTKDYPTKVTVANTGGSTFTTFEYSNCN